MAQSVITLLEQPELYAQLAGNAAKDARQRFDLQRQCDAYLDWYDTIVERWQTNKSQIESANGWSNVDAMPDPGRTATAARRKNGLALD